MEELKNLFGDAQLSYDEFEAKLNENAGSIKLANLKSGAYVDRNKLESANRGYAELETKYKDLVESTKNYEAEKQELEAFRVAKQDADFVDKISKANVDSKFAKFVLSEVKANVADNVTFDDALKAYVKENPQYLTSKRGIFTKGNTNPNLEHGNTNDTKSINQQMNEIIRLRNKE